MIQASPYLGMGPVQFAFSGESSRLVRYVDWPYAGFFRQAAASGVDTPVGTVALEVRLKRGMPAIPQGEPDFTAGNNWAVWNTADTMHFCSGFAGRAHPRFACDLASSLAHGDLYVDGTLEDRPLRYPLDQVLTWGLLGRCHGLLLHAAAVVRDGIGYVLAGRSGAGKSTLAGFCHDQGWEILNDDRVIVHPDPQGGWQVSGTPWHGSGAYASNRTVPLKGVYVLTQDTRNAAIVMSGRDARYALMDVAAIAWFSEAWSQAALDTLARVCDEVPVCRLHFTRSVSAIACLEQGVAA